jgi:hypothetical protein
VAQGARRQQAAKEVEGLRADGTPPGALGLLGIARPPFGGPGLDSLEAAGVELEELVHGLAVALPQLVVRVVAVAAAALDRLVVGDVAR